MAKARKIVLKSGRILVITVIGLLVLVFLAMFFINTNSGKKMVARQVESYLEDKLKTRVQIGSVDYSLPEWIELKNVYFEDQNKDTLFFGRELSVDVNMLKLLAGNTDIQKVYLNNIYANIYRNESDSFFNYQYIIDAFTGNQPETAIKDTAEFKMTLSQLLFDTVSIHYDDRNAGSRFVARIDNLNSTISVFRPERLYFDINTFLTKGVYFDMVMYKESKPDTTVAVHTPPPPPDDESSTFGFYIRGNKLLLQDAYVNILDTVTGLRYFNDVKKLYLSDAMYSLEQNVIRADSALLDSGKVTFIHARNPTVSVKQEPVADTTSPPLYISANVLELTNIDGVYTDPKIRRQDGFDPNHINGSGLNVKTTGFIYTCLLYTSPSPRD